jgi:hypothetical protein
MARQVADMPGEGYRDRLPADRQADANKGIDQPDRHAFPDSYSLTALPVPLTDKRASLVVLSQPLHRHNRAAAGRDVGQ